MEFIQQNWLKILPLILSFASIIIAWKSWKKSRSIYNLEFHEFLHDQNRDRGNKVLREKLSSGKYTILHADFRNGQYNVLVGKIKK